ncbi:multidrug ABC transporter permease [Altererythrobacter sp. B11]|uniref:HlyD family secretion protein n=1 Tax=Altererythrobacter sp. B11 TaxID=2060312 RepID=UPI000DC6FCE7|nr:HlyD family secretion protein [Altererythrobacter sp. B11]BBC71907.1 multidrug ABC transporter permease [Altererythrobacter sp. B11]
MPSETHEPHEAVADTPETEAATPRRTSPLKRRGVRIGLLVALAAALILGGIWFYDYWTVGRFQESTNDAYLQADAQVVAPKIGGYVEEVFVTDNQAVKAGDPLFRIDPGDYQSDVAQAQAQIDVAEASAQALRAQISEQEAAVQAAQAQLASARSDLNLARTTLDRYRALAATGAESRETLSQAQNRFDQAKAAVAAQQANLQSARRRVTTLQAQVQQARAQAEGSEAARSTASTNLESTVVRASVAGRVGNKTVQLGQYVQPGTRTMSIVPIDKIYLVANFKETQIGQMRVGQPAMIEVDALDGVEIRGHVESFSPGTGAQFSLLPPENATGNFTKIVQRVPVRIAIDADPEVRKLLVPGMSVDVTVDTRSARGSLEAITKQQEAADKAAD